MGLRTVLWAVALPLVWAGLSGSLGHTKQSMIRFEYPLGIVLDKPVVYATFSEPPREDFRTSLHLYTDLQSIVVSNPVGGPVWQLDSTIAYLTQLKVARCPSLLRGQLPSQLGLLTDLFLFDAKQGALAGTLPSELGLLTNALAVHVSTNPDLAGTIPSQWGQLTSLVVVELDECDFEGTLPTQLGRVRNATEMYLNGNRLSGTIPSELFSPVLEFFQAKGNRLVGSLPSQLGLCTKLANLQLGANRLSGSIPSHLGNALALNELALHENALEGQIPSQLGLLSSLGTLRLGSNRLSGSIPFELGRLTLLKILELHENALSGSVPARVFALAALEALRVDSNDLRGRIPASASDLWRDHCDHSGLHDRNCNYDCVGCATGFLLVVECGPTGEAPSCLAWWWIVAALGGSWLVGTVLATTVNPPNVPLRKLCLTGAFATFGVVDLVVDYLFALNAAGVVQTLSYMSWGIVLGLSFLATLRIGLAEGLRAHPLRLAGACVLCAANVPSLLALVTTNAGGVDEARLKRRKEAVTQVVLWLTLSETLFQGTLQLISVLLGDTSDVTALSLGFSVFQVLSMFTVGVVLVLSREPRDDLAIGEAKRGWRSKRGLAAVAFLLPTLALYPARNHLATTTTTTTTTVVPTAAATASTGQVLWAADIAVASTELSRSLAPIAVWESGPRQRAVVGKSDVGCQSTAFFEVDLPFVCSLGYLVALFYYQQKDEADSDFPLVIASAPRLVSLVSLSRQTLVSELGLLSELVLLLLERPNSQLPSQIGQLSKLMLMKYSSTTVPATIPSEIGRAAALIDVNFADTALHGPLPTQFGLLTDLSFFDMSGSQDLGGSFPSQLVQLRDLWYFDIEQTAIGGTLPSQIGDWEALRTLRLGDSSVGGTLPSQIGRWAQLEDLRVCNTELTGTIPSQMWSLTTLTYLQMCDLSGELPTTLGHLTMLTSLTVDDPLVFGALPTQLGLLANLVELRLEQGHSSSSVPTQLGLLTKLTSLVLASKSLRGSVPSELGLLTLLTKLSLANNTLHGTLPSQLARLTALEDVDIDHNGLSGTFPEQLSDSALEVWWAACDYSGVQGKHCRRSCAACPFWSLEVQSCDPWGYDQVCVPPFATFLLLVCFAVLEVVVVKRIGKRRAKHLAQGAAVSVLSGAHLLFDLMFVLDADGPIRGVGVAVLCASMLARLILVVAELLRLQRREDGADLRSALHLIAAAVVVCVVDPFALEQALCGGKDERVGKELGRVVRRMVVVVLLSDVPMCVLQLVRIASMATPSWVVVSALVFSLLSLSMATVVVRKGWCTRAQSQSTSPAVAAVAGKQTQEQALPTLVNAGL